jgi:hypothetical protein
MYKCCGLSCMHVLSTRLMPWHCAAYMSHMCAFVFHTGNSFRILRSYRVDMHAQEGCTQYLSPGAIAAL